MATYSWSTLNNNQVIAFDPAADVLNFDSASISAADLSFNYTYGGWTVFAVSDKTLTLQTDIRTLTTSNLTFVNASLLLIGDNTTGTTADDSENTLVGGNGADRFYGLLGNDSMVGGPGSDVFLLSPYSGWGNDTIHGGLGSDTMAYSPIASVAASVNLATGSATSANGNTIFTSIETVLATPHNDTLIGGDPSHGLNAQGDTTAERFRGRGGDDTIIGGSGADFFTVADYSDNTAGQPVTANLATGVANDGLGGTDTLTNVDGVWGGAGNDTLWSVGGSLNRSPSGTFFEVFRGNAGDDLLNGNNALTLGVGSARADYSNNTSTQSININLGTGVALDGWGGTDTLRNIGHVYGGAGNDTFTGAGADEDFDGGFGNDTIDGGGGSDTVRFQQSTAGVIVNLSATAITVNNVIVASGTANDAMGGTDTLINIENVRGSDFDDYIRGSDALTIRQFFAGDAGNDTVDGGGGIDLAEYSHVALAMGGLNAFIENGSGTVDDRMGGVDTLINIEGLAGTHSKDALTGGLGDQWFRGNGGSDVMNGGAGSDWVIYSNDPSGVTINLGAGTATDGWSGPSGILGLGGTDTLISIENAEGSESDDYIIGSAAANVLRGLGGNDTIDGRLGNDTIEGGLGFDTAIFSAARGAYTISVAANAITISGADGVDLLTGIERAQFADVAVSLNKPLLDFNFDGKSDLVIRSDATGEVQLLQMDGLRYVAYEQYPWGANWQLMHAHADFNGDGKSDLVIRHDTTGEIQLLQMDGLTYTSYQQYPWGAQWQVVEARADFNGDGKSDLVIQNDNSGEVQLLQMDGLRYVAYQQYPWGPNWQVVDARADFDGDGKSDLVIQHSTTGEIQLLRMNGLIYTAYQQYPWGPHWQLADARGDFNADGRTDLVIRHEITGEVRLLLMNGLTPTASQAYVWGAQWQVVNAHADFNGDGKSDLVIQNDTTGEIQLLQMDGLRYTGYLQLQFGTDWRVADAQVDLDGSGKSDLVLENSATGVIRLLQMDGLNVSATQNYPWGTEWHAVNAGGDAYSLGDAANNTLRGGPGDDVLKGGDGADSLRGGAGNDILMGGAGSDSFVYAALNDRGTKGDLIVDFSKAGGDVLHVRELLQGFSGYNGANAFTGGYLQLSASGGNTVVRVDADGSTGAEHSLVTLATITNVLLDASDAANLLV